MKPFTSLAAGACTLLAAALTQAQDLAAEGGLAESSRIEVASAHPVATQPRFPLLAPLALELAAPGLSPAPTPGAATAAPEASLEPTRRWYGWGTLLTDGAALVLTVASFNAGNGPGADALATAAVGSYLFGGPLVHLSHSRPGAAAGSLALRGGLPFLMGGLGVALEDCSGGDFCGVAGALLGGALGIVSAVVIDAAALGYEAVPEKLSATPTVSVLVDRERALLTAQGVF